VRNVLHVSNNLGCLSAVNHTVSLEFGCEEGVGCGGRLWNNMEWGRWISDQYFII